MEDPSSMVAADAEAAFLASKRRTGNEWEIYKENVRPSKRGRDVNLLNQALKSHNDPVLKKSLLERRRRLIDAIDEYKGEDPIQPWIECITWVQESFPTGGECSGLIVIYEQCVRTFWHEDRYKEDLRYLKIWLEYASNCADCEVIYRFLEANQIGQTKAIFYSSYALHMESKNMLKKADEIFSTGIARKAEPLDNLQFAYRKFILRSAGKNNVEDDEPTDANLPVRSFGTVLETGENGRHPICGPTIVKKKTYMQRANANAPLSIYDDTKSGEGHQPGIVKRDTRAWPSLGSQSERNKENYSIPSKWTSHKIPQKIGFRPALAASSPCIEVFVDEECAQTRDTRPSKRQKFSILKLRQASNRNLNKDTELLKENPLRNFPSSSLPR